MEVCRPALDEIKAAARTLGDVLVHTPLVPLHDDKGDLAEAPILLKPEIHQRVGSFKLRGVFTAVASLPAEIRRRGTSSLTPRHPTHARKRSSDWDAPHTPRRSPLNTAQTRPPTSRYDSPPLTGSIQVSTTSLVIVPGAFNSWRSRTYRVPP